MVSPATTTTEEVPAKYTTRKYKRLVSPATTNSTDVPAEYTNRKYQKLVNDATTTSTEVAAQYKTRSYEKLASDANATSADTDANYTTRSYQRLVSPASTNVITVPAEYKSVSRRQLVKKGGFSEWREVVCDADITSDLVRRVQSALMSRGFDVGTAGADNVMGAATKAALVKFQKENNLPVGQLDLETLKVLGVK